MKKQLSTQFKLLMLGWLGVLLTVVSPLSAQQLQASVLPQQMAQRISLQLNNIGVSELLEAIEEQSEYVFIYSHSNIDSSIRISVEAVDEPVEEVLSKALRPHEIGYTIVGNQVILKHKEMVRKIPQQKTRLSHLLAVPSDDVLTTSSALHASVKEMEKIITGQVTDENNVPLPGVNILVKGTAIGTVTDVEGNYRLSAPDDATALVFSFIGYATEEVEIGNQNVINVSIMPDIQALSEVVVTALGMEQEKRKLGYTVTELKGGELAQTNEVNPINALQGKVAGVQIDQGGGGLFGTSKILIRGNSTLSNNNQPIFVIDGVFMENDVFSGTGRDFGNNLKNLNMEDFESVSVLKGSAAAALYGSRAINGVILITTKKGRKNSGIGLSVTQNINVFQPFSGPEFQDVFGGGSVGAFFTDRRDPNYQPDEAWRTKVFPVDPISGQPYIDPQINRELENWGPRMEGQEVLNYDGTPTRFLPQPDNFMDAFRNGFGSNTNVALDGGTDRSTFRLSYSHNSSQGVVYNNNMTKNGFNLRATHELTSFLQADASMDYTTFEGKNPPRLGGLDAFASYNFGKLYSWILPRNYDTEYWMKRENYTSSLGGAPNPADPDETNKAPESRFWFSLFENNYLQNEESLRGRLALTATLTDWAKVIVEGNFYNNYVKQENQELGQGRDFTGGMYGLGHSTRKSNFMKAIVMVNKAFDETWEFSGYIGAESQQFSRTFNYSETRGGLLYPGNFFLANSVDPQFTQGGISERKTINSLYSSVDVSFKDQLFLLATWRGDWSSALTYVDGSGNNFFNYPAVSLSWVLSETLATPSWVTFAKLRGNIAALGRDTNPFILNPGFTFNGFTNIRGNDLPLSTFSNRQVLESNIKPERKIAKEVGLEARLFDNRIGFDLSLYQDNTKNQIIDISAPNESGVESILINAGNIQNRGIELSIDGTPLRIGDFQWNTMLNFSRNRNLIVDLYEGREEYNLDANIGEISTWAVVGKSYGTLRSSIESKIFQAEDAEGNPVANPNNGLPELSWRADARAAFPARSNELRDVGDINANFRAGWNNTFNYKNFSLGVLLDAKVGGDFVLLSYRYGTHTGVLPNTLEGRDAEYGGITWTSAYDGETYDDGIIPEGVFAQGQTVTQPDGTQAEVGGLTYQQAYDAGLVEPTHAPQFFYRYGSSSTGVSDYWVFENSWVSMREISLSYRLPQAALERLNLKGLSISLIGRDLFYLYNSLPYNFNPASNNSNNTAFSGEQGFLPMTRTLGATLRFQL
ncbi:SusC/RagA family TonB-linked outer membrane protein [Catalinimonas niigatensis]|uniref:SusC/RagA family TonB-linked outer membrane protein n=1 Tax=Catalinimonas niigatensis TaxID=1397264 RepID=UPI0026668F3B|nr:SusC/RagA family TonB-linked outer membrane protein [Catalinimonas niigatensis]WPP51464.1 SusC/RagA family TonB-linked outer membrane protein [Catalinimonas niigatensis]